MATTAQQWWRQESLPGSRRCPSPFELPPSFLSRSPGTPYGVILSEAKGLGAAREWQLNSTGGAGCHDPALSTGLTVTAETVRVVQDNDRAG